jgi:hypothetical protein
MVQECNIYSSKGTSKTPEKRLNTRQQLRVEMGEEKMGKGGERGTGERGRESLHIRLMVGRQRKGFRTCRTTGCQCTHKNLLEGSKRPGGSPGGQGVHPLAPRLHRSPRKERAQRSRFSSVEGYNTGDFPPLLDKTEGSFLRLGI